jgi:ribosome recycling factor
MRKAVENLERQLVGIRSGTVSAGLIDTVKVLFEGQMTPVSYVAYAASCKGGISVVPHDPQLAGAIINALKAANVNAYLFSKSTIMVTVPSVTGEEMERVNAHIRRLGEEAKISVRNLRKNCKQSFSGTKDEARLYDKDLQQITDSAVGEIEDIIAAKTLQR